jgi:hypothetical protein
MSTCKKIGCSNEVTREGMAYCSPSCAPLGRFGVIAIDPRTGLSYTNERGVHLKPYGEALKPAAPPKKPRSR